MSGISGIGSVLNSVLGAAAVTKSGKTAVSVANTDDSGWSDKMTISQIRDKVDGMALNGQFTTMQCMSLMFSGLMDMNVYDKSYQPADSSMPGRDTVGTSDASAIMQQKANWNLSYNDKSTASLNQSLADLFKAKESTGSFSVNF